MLIGLHGPKQAGKDTIYERARHIMADVLPVERMSFADLLYESAAAALGVGEVTLRCLKNDDDAKVAVLGNGGLYAEQTVREYLQRYGTEAHRNIFGADFWVENVKSLERHGGRLVMVTDVRFENEARAVARAGGLVVRVVGPRDVENTGDGHASEAGLPDHLIDLWLHNTKRDDGFRSLDANLETVLRIALKVPA